MEILKAATDFFVSLTILTLQLGVILGISEYGLIKLFDFIF